MDVSKLFPLAVIIAVTGILIIYPLTLIAILILIATIATIAFAAFTVIWVHLALSSTHKTTVGAESLFKNMEQHRNKIMVKCRLKNFQYYSFISI